MLFARQPARIHFHACFDVGRKREMLVDDFPSRRISSGRRNVGEPRRNAVAPLCAPDSASVPSLPLRGPAPRRRPCFVVVERDDGGATAKQQSVSQNGM